MPSKIFMKKMIEAYERFWSKIDIKDIHECWEFTGAKDSCGYGSFWFESKAVVASRHALSLISGILPQDKFALHSCDNSSCCNPHHLRWGSQKDNMKDMISRCRAGWHKVEEFEFF